MTNLSELLKDVPSPQDLVKQINNVIENKDTDESVNNFFKNYKLISKTWDQKNFALLNFYAVIILDSFFLNYLRLLEKYFVKKYSVDEIDIKSRKIDEVIQEIHKKISVEISEADRNWLNLTVIRNIEAAIKTIDISNLTINDLSVLAKIGQKEIYYLEKQLEENAEDIESDIRQCFLNYIDELINAEYLNNKEMETYTQPNRIKVVGKYENINMGIINYVGVFSSGLDNTKYKLSGGN